MQKEIIKPKTRTVYKKNSNFPTTAFTEQKVMVYGYVRRKNYEKAQAAVKELIEQWR